MSGTPVLTALGQAQQLVAYARAVGMKLWLVYTEPTIPWLFHSWPDSLDETVPYVLKQIEESRDEVIEALELEIWLDLGHRDWLRHESERLRTAEATT